MLPDREYDAAPSSPERCAHSPHLVIQLICRKIQLLNYIQRFFKLFECSRLPTPYFLIKNLNFGPQSFFDTLRPYYLETVYIFGDFASQRQQDILY